MNVSHQEVFRQRPQLPFSESRGLGRVTRRPEKACRTQPPLASVRMGDDPLGAVGKRHGVTEGQ
jgi:hypothetical protein